MLYVPPIGDLDGQCGLWARSELEEMDQKFVSACEAAFAAGLESRAAAAATVRVGSLRNGKEAAIEGVIESAWRYLRTNMDAGVDVTFLEVAARCPGVSRGRVYEGLKRRLRESGVMGG